jgi:hypothetical protein
MVVVSKKVKWSEVTSRLNAVKREVKVGKQAEKRMIV